MEEDLRQLIQKNFEYTKAVHEDVKKIRKYILWQQILSVVKIFLVVVPIVIAIIFAAPFLKQAFETYKEIMAGLKGVTGGGIPDDLMRQFLK